MQRMQLFREESIRELEKSPETGGPPSGAGVIRYPG